MTMTRISPGIRPL